MSNNQSKNQTYTFLSPILNVLPKSHLNALVNLEIEGIYLEDCEYTDIKDISVEPYLYIRVKNNNKSFTNIKLLKNSKYYVDNYLDSLSCDYSILVIRIPKRFERAYFKFIQSKYSEMYSKEELEEIGEIEGVKSSLPAMQVLKTKLAKQIFIETLEKKFGTVLTEDEITGEVCLPIDLKKEVLNYCQETSSIVSYLKTLNT